jgi:energy-coupling factor transport system permease protein
VDAGAARMTLTLYVPRNTLVHRLHPVTKLLAFLGLVVAAFVVDRPELLLALGLPAALLLVLVGGGSTLRRFLPALVIIVAVTIVIWTFFYGAATRAEGFRYGVSMAARLATFLVTGFLFLSVTRMEEVAYALRQLGVPYLVGFTLTLAFRLVPVFFDSAVTIVQAQRCRGLDLRRGGLLTRLRRFAPVIVPVFIGALRRADRMAMALELRGFNSGRPRTRFPRPGPGVGDLAALVLVGGTVILYLALWRTGAGRLGTFC